MKFYKIHPEVPASYGENTVFNRTTTPMTIEDLHLKFEGWLGSDIMEISPVFFCTNRLAKALKEKHFTGIKMFHELEVGKSENFLEHYPDKDIPECKLIEIEGKPFNDDFGILRGYLIISETVRNLIFSYNTDGVEIEDAFQ